jgi:hypothetical protein
MVRHIRRRGKSPKILGIKEYRLRPPIVLQVFNFPLAEYASIGSLLDKVSKIEQLRSALFMLLNRLASGDVTDARMATEAGRLAADIVVASASADTSYQLISKKLPGNVVEAGSSMKLVIRLAAAAGILHQLGKKEESLHLLRLAKLEVDNLQNARKVYKDVDRWIWLSTCIGDDLVVLLNEYEKGAVGLADIIREVGLLLKQEIDFSRKALGAIKPASKITDVMKTLDECEEVLKREVLEKFQV